MRKTKVDTVDFFSVCTYGPPFVAGAHQGYVCAASWLASWCDQQKCNDCFKIWPNVWRKMHYAYLITFVYLKNISKKKHHMIIWRGCLKAGNCLLCGVFLTLGKTLSQNTSCDFNIGWFTANVLPKWRAEASPEKTVVTRCPGCLDKWSNFEKYVCQIGR